MQKILLLYCFIIYVAIVFSRAVNEKNDFAQPTPIHQINQLSLRPECRNDVENYCKYKLSQLPHGSVLSDMDTLECFKNVIITKQAQLQPLCAQLVWKYKVYLTQGPNFTKAIMNFCNNEAEQIPQIKNCAENQTPGYALSCIMEIKQNISKNTRCFEFLEKTQQLAFSDFQSILPSVKSCAEVINDFLCGAVPIPLKNNDVAVPEKKGVTLRCLIERIWGDGNSQQYQETLKIIPQDCHSQVDEITILQFNDFNFDQPLFLACRQELKTFCGDRVAGEDVVFQCLFNNKDHLSVNPKCSNLLTERAKMVGSNYKLAHSLINACSNEMEAYRCIPVAGYEKSLNFHLNAVLYCLENNYNYYTYYYNKDNKNPSNPLQTLQPPPLAFSNMCLYEMLNYRKLMINEFQMSPELVLNCANEIVQHCNQNYDIEAKGKTLHCLMAVVKNRNILTSQQCEHAINEVLKVADIGSNYQVDRVLYYSCRPLIEGKCKMHAVSNENTLNCLVGNLGKSDMTEDCEQRLVEIMYFMVRDWTLDTELHQACHREAVERCSAVDDWSVQNRNNINNNHNNNNKIDPGPLVLACLYRAGYDVEKPLSQNCAQNVRRVLRSRALRVNLLPELEEACRDALVEYCSKDVKPYEELNCLQENFQTEKFKSQYSNCYNEVYAFTQLETKDTRLNRLLILACKPIIETYCNDYSEKDFDNGNIQQCLVEHKNEEMNQKCRSFVTHFELISFRDYRLNPEFSRGCQSDIQKYCQSFNNDEGSIIRCLSERMFEHKVLKDTRDLTEECKTRLKIIHHQQSKVNFDNMKHIADADPELISKCNNDLKRLQCLSKKRKTFEDVFECLRENYETLDSSCQSLVIIREQIEAVDNSFDEVLQKHCKHDINVFCKGEKQDKILNCLKEQRVVKFLEKGCQKIVIKRMLEQNNDDLLNPDLFTLCKEDAMLYCPKEYEKINDSRYNKVRIGGNIVTCLRRKFSQLNNPVLLSQKCKNEISKIILESELDVRTDKELYKACYNIINSNCSDVIIKKKGDSENVLECLKDQFYKKHISDENCAAEVTRIIQESLTDIHLDTELYKACSLEVQRVCSDVPSGDSRIITCLLNALQNNKEKLLPLCQTKLSERHRLWNIAHEKNKMALPQNWNDLFDEFNNYPKRNSILLYFVIVLVFFLLIGCMCGRLSKRQYMELKNR